MRVTPHLEALSWRHQIRLRRLQNITTAIDPAGGHRPADRAVSFAVIEATNLWARYCRYFFLSCALGTKDSKGAPVRPATGRLRSTEDAITLAIRATKLNWAHRQPPWTPRDEPDWQMPATFLRAFRALSTPNLGQVEAALSLTTDVTQRLPTFRNFYAHRGPDTGRKAVGVGTAMLIAGRHPTQILLTPRPNRPVPLLLDWLHDLEALVQLMAV
jgi:hypothetical protein